MEELGSLWSYQEGMDDLKQKLVYTSLELESVRAEAAGEIKKSKENVRSLLNLLKVAYQERDEAREQLRKVVDKLKPSSPVLPMTHNSGITESTSQSHNSSPVSSFFDPVVSSPGFSGNNQQFVSDPFEHLVKGMLLPEKGKLLQAVMDAGPLLSNLLVAGPLPRWRNPPPLQTFDIPTLSIAHKPINSSPYFDVSCGSSQLNPISSSSSPMLDFRTGPCLSTTGRWLTSGVNMSGQIPVAKRQRLF